MLMYKVYKYKFYGIPFTFINCLQNYQLFAVLSEVI